MWAKKIEERVLDFYYYIKSRPDAMELTGKSTFSVENEIACPVKCLLKIWKRKETLSPWAKPCLSRQQTKMLFANASPFLALWRQEDNPIAFPLGYTNTGSFFVHFTLIYWLQRFRKTELFPWVFSLFLEFWVFSLSLEVNLWKNLAIWELLA